MVMTCPKAIKPTNIYLNSYDRDYACKGPQYVPLQNIKNAQCMGEREILHIGVHQLLKKTL